MMLVLLASLIATYLLLAPYRANASAGAKWSVHIPVSVYLGWITVATIANITDWLDYVGWNRFGLSDLTWMGIILVVVATLVGYLNLTRRDVGYALVILWALAGIAIKFSDVSFVLWATLAVFLWVAASLAWGLLAKSKITA